MLVAPFTQSEKDWCEALPLARQTVFHLWRNLRIDFTVNESIPLELPQLIGHHPLRCPRDPSTQLVEA